MLLLLIWQEAPTRGLEVGGPLSCRIAQSVQSIELHWHCNTRRHSSLICPLPSLGQFSWQSEACENITADKGVDVKKWMRNLFLEMWVCEKSFLRNVAILSVIKYQKFKNRKEGREGGRKEKKKKEGRETEGERKKENRISGFTITFHAWSLDSLKVCYFLRDFTQHCLYFCQNQGNLNCILTIAQ